MDITHLISERQEQLSELYEALEQEYNLLQTAYQKQKWEIAAYKDKANYWQVQFDRQKARELSLSAKIEELKAALRKREQQLFGKSSEQANSKEIGAHCKEPEVLRPRGQQKGNPAPKRRKHEHLPVQEELVTIVESEAKCRCCGLSFVEMSGTEDSTIYEVINVNAYQRRVRRQKYKRRCECPESIAGSKIVTAPVMERLLLKSNFGISIWALLLIKKYVHQQPLNRSLQELTHNDLSLSAATMLEGFRKILPLLLPIYDLIVERSQSGTRWHADETRWRVFEELEGKNSQLWYLWVFSNEETAVYRLDPTRSAKVPLAHFGEEKREDAILNVDRYSAYKVIARKGIVVLAYCWAHVRRDFIEYAKGYPEDETWALSWVEAIAKLYHINNQRVACLDDQKHQKKFKVLDAQLKTEIEQFKARAEEALMSNSLSAGRRPVLKSLQKHFMGLSVFVDHPEVPMDNNVAENALRSPVVGRKNYYGSHAIWSGELSAVMFTIIATLKLWKINPHTWLLSYFDGCAKMQSKAPSTELLQRFLPWNMPEERKTRFGKGPIGEDSS